MNPMFFYRQPRFPSFGSPIDDGIASLRIAIRTSTDPSIQNFGGAVQALQAAGNAAVGGLGPAIDALSGGDPTVMKTTQLAWSKNGALAALPVDNTADAGVLAMARQGAQFMLDRYSQAFNLAKSLHYVPHAAPAPSPSGGGGGGGWHPSAGPMPAPTPLETHEPVPVALPWFERLLHWLRG